MAARRAVGLGDPALQLGPFQGKSHHKVAVCGSPPPGHRVTIESALVLALALAMVGLALGAGAVQRWHSGRTHQGERVRRFYDALSCGIIVQDASGKVVHANQAARDLLGTTDVVLAGSPGADHRVVHEDGSSAEGDAHPLSLARRTGQPVRGVVHGVFAGTPAERWCLVDAVPVFDPATGLLVEAVASLTDITQRRRAETALLNTTDTLSALIQASPLAIFAFDPAGKVTSWNAAAERLFGWRASEVLGHTPAGDRARSGAGIPRAPPCRAGGKVVY